MVASFSEMIAIFSEMIAYFSAMRASIAPMIAPIATMRAIIAAMNASFSAMIVIFSAMRAYFSEMIALIAAMAAVFWPMRGFFPDVAPAIPKIEKIICLGHLVRDMKPPVFARNNSTRLAVFALFVVLNLVFATTPMNAAPETKPTPPAKTQLATFGGGCFWCLEALFETFDGVKAVTSGYSAGKTPNPTYKEVCGGDTGHAEVVQIEFDPAKISYEQLLAIFWDIHDPTTLNRQGADVGTQYRSIILTHDDAQKAAAEKSKQAAGAKFKTPITTEIAPLVKYYLAEDYHQDYFRKNPNVPYCAYVISPKLQKLQKSKHGR